MSAPLRPDGNPLRAAMMEAGVIRPPDRETTTLRLPTDAVVFRLDDLGRSLAAKRIRSPEPEEYRGRREDDRWPF
jgi:hypothetical protein